MTVHGTPRASLENELRKAKRRAAKPYKKQKTLSLSDADKQRIAKFDTKHGINRQTPTLFGLGVRHHSRSRKPVTLPKLDLGED